MVGPSTSKASARRFDWKRLRTPLVLVAMVAVVLTDRVLTKRRPPSHEPEPSFRITASAIPGLNVAAHIDVIAKGASEFMARYGADRSYAQEIRWRPLTEGRGNATLIGLKPASTTMIQVVVRYAGGATRTSGDLVVTTAPLEPFVPAGIVPSIDRTHAKDLLVLSMNGLAGDGGLLTVIDRSGTVLWYRRCGCGAFSLAALPHLVLNRPEGGFEEVDLAGLVIRKWGDPTRGHEADRHDMQLLPNENALFINLETKVSSRDQKANRVDSAVRELTPNGDVVWQWSSSLEISEDEIVDDPWEPADPRTYDTAHLNSIEPMPNGDLLLSLRNTSTIVKVGRKAARIEWRLGGKRSDFRIEGDPLGGFHRQHDARLVGTDRILLFDNGNLREPSESRAVEYRLDFAAKTAHMVWQFRHQPPLFTRISGSVSRLENGDTLIAWGPRGVVTEVTAAGEVVWEAEVPNYGVYRARAIASLEP